MNYNILHSIISNSINENFPSKMNKFKKHKHKHSKWITRGIFKSIIYRDNLYVNLKKLDIYSDNYQTVNMNFLNYNKLLKKNIKLAKKMYYFSCFEKCENDIKSTWTNIKDILNKKTSATSISERFNINNHCTEDKQVIADSFNTYFTNIGVT